MPEENSTENNFESLLSRLVDETIGGDELLMLEEQLDGNSEAQSRYLRYLDLHSELLCNGGENAESIKVSRSKSRCWLPAALTAAAAMIAIGATLFFRIDTNFRPIFQVVAGGGPLEWEGWNGETLTAPRAGASLPAGTIETFAAESWIELAFPDGTSVSLTGPSVLTVSLVEGCKILQLKKGNLSVDAARQPEGRAMRVITASAEAEVLGTQFNVKADSYSTYLTVNKGKVRMKRLADGKVEDVSANEELVAALEKGTAFDASPHQVSVASWKSEIPRDAIQGLRETSRSGVEGIRAVPHIWKGEPNDPTEPILLYSAVFDPSPRRSPPLQIEEGARIEIRGRLNHSHGIHTGFATSEEGGGFAGKYAVYSRSSVEADENGQFQIELPISSFAPTDSRFPNSPVGQEVMYLWIQTVKSDAGLVIESVELKK